LGAGDILFVDGSHISKTGSDVNFLMFDVLPRLKTGVIIHFHDITWPFEYPSDWIVKNGVHYNEAYLVHAFLQNNGAYKIKFWAQYLARFAKDELFAAMPVIEKDLGSSLWIEKV
jgi:hypothetical protein